MTFMNHCGAGKVSLQRLELLTPPEQTETYVPVGHDWLALQVKEIGCEYLGDCIESQYSVNNDGNQLFGVHKFMSSLSKDMCITLGFRNSYDKTMSVGLVGGANVFVCDNMAFYGQEKRLRKHTKNVFLDVEKYIKEICAYVSGGGWEKFLAFKDTMADIELTDDEAFKFLGLCRGNDALRATQFNRALGEWKKPAHEEWLPRTAWSLYNACTEALKSSNPLEVTNKYLGLNHLAMIEWDKPEPEVEPEQPKEVVGVDFIRGIQTQQLANRFQMLEMGD